MKDLLHTTTTKFCMCVAAEMLRKVCVNLIEKLTMTFQPLLHHDAYHM